jgi:hypothetical protein
MHKIPIVGLLLVTGCAVEGLDVGGDNPASGGSSNGASSSGGVGQVPGPPEPLKPLPPRDGCATDPEFEEFVGTWEGGTYDFSFTLVQPVRFEINGISTAGGICGTVLYGEELPVAPVVDPDAMYPTPDSEVSQGTIHDGFVYTIVSGGAQDSSLNIGLNGAEFWRPWCEAQAPVFDSDGDAYRTCVEELGSGHFDYETNICTLSNNMGVSVQHPVAKCLLCFQGSRGVCACDANGCGVAWNDEIRLGFELMTEGDTLKLTEVVSANMAQTVLERVE